MKRTQAAQKQDTTKEGVLYMAVELSASNWKIAFGDGSSNPRFVDVPAWDTVGVSREIEKSRIKYHLSETTRVMSVQEAGRDGFSVHRFQESLGIESLVVDSSSIEVPRQSRRRKTDRLDAQSLLRMLIRYAGGERQVFRVLHVPSVEEEESRRPHRELGRLKKERTSLTNRMRSTLAAQGIRWKGKIGPMFFDQLSQVRLFDGSGLPPGVLEELRRGSERLTVISVQVAEIEGMRRKRLRTSEDVSSEKARRLMSLKGIGETTASVLAHEFFWRKFANRREVGSAAGLVASPYQSGEVSRARGISKAGNRRVRTLMIELAWGWQRWQPGSALSRWFQERFGHGSGRVRRTGVVALARKLLIALWRYVEEGVIPEGAVLMPSRSLQNVFFTVPPPPVEGERRKKLIRKEKRER